MRFPPHSSTFFHTERVLAMATKSFYKGVMVKDRRFCLRLLSALENAEKFQSDQKPLMNKKVEFVKKERIKEFFDQK